MRDNNNISQKQLFINGNFVGFNNSNNIDLNKEAKDAISKMGYEIYNQLNEKIDKNNIEIKNHIKTNVSRLNDLEKGIKNINEKLDILISNNNSSINNIKSLNKTDNDSKKLINNNYINNNNNEVNFFENNKDLQKELSLDNNEKKENLIKNIPQLILNIILNI